MMSCFFISLNVIKICSFSWGELQVGCHNPFENLLKQFHVLIGNYFINAVFLR